MKINSFKSLGIVLGAMLIIQFVGCRKQSIATDFPDNVTVSKFNSEQTLSTENGKNLNLDVFGIMEFKVVDSLLVVSSSQGDNSWYLYRLPSCDSITALLRQGGGPLEVEMNVPTTFASFNKDSKGHIIATIPQNITRKILKVDLNESIDSMRTVGTSITADDLTQFNIITKDLGGGKYIMIDIDPENLAVNRMLIDNGNHKKTVPFLTLNRKKADSMQDIVSLVPNIAVSPDSDRVVEILPNSPVINLYSLEGSESLSIVGDFEETKQVKKARDNGTMLPYYKNINSYLDFFTVLQPVYDSDNKEVANNLLFFGWDGKPLEKLTIPMPDVRNTDIDLLSGNLYILLPEEDVIRSFPLNHLPSK